MNEFSTLLIVAWAVYLSETVWWVRDRQLVLTGRTIGAFRAHYGPRWLVSREQGTFCPRFIPPFEYSFAFDPGGARRSSRVKDPARVVHAARDVIEAAARLKLIGEAIFGYVFVVIPVVIALFGFLRTWIILLGLLVASILVAAFAYRSAWRRLYPSNPRGWRSHAALMVVSPLGTIRAADRLTRTALAEYAPMIALTMLATRGEAVRVARLAYFDSGTRETPPVFNRDDYALIAPLMAADVLAPPARENAEMRGYCPRCHAQLTHATGLCPDCHTIGIFRFASNG